MDAAQIEYGGLRAINSKRLTEEELKSTTMDYLCGFEIIDSYFRLFIIEGLSDGGISK